MIFTDKAYKVFELFHVRWALVTVGTIDDYNTMTITWGGMGTLWGPPYTMFIGEAENVIER